MRYFFHIAYRGMAYGGFQKHPGYPNVQGTIEKSLSQIFKGPLSIVGCGRTDAHVHAAQFFFHMDFEEEWDFDLLFRLNKSLPSDIAVFDILQMEGLPHARFDAVQRSYVYHFHKIKNPFLEPFSAYYPDELNLEKMRVAASILPDYSDYRAFCTSPAKNEHTICHVSSAELLSDAKGENICFKISSNRFLSKMIRIIMGRLLDIGSGVLSLNEFESYLAGKTTPQTLVPAYPQGLYLSKVIYPYLDLPCKGAFPMLPGAGPYS